MANPASPSFHCQWFTQVSDIPQEDWDRLALPLETPFLEWAWLHNLETSGSAVGNKGWQPCHLALRHGQTLVAIAPLYVKSHSYGEFVFDHQWADLAARLGVDYYPKLVGMTPFTPAEGYRFLIDPDYDPVAVCGRMVAEIDHFCDRQGLSGCHFLFVDPQWQEIMEAIGFRAWLHHSYIWRNQNYGEFEDYLGGFKSNQRKKIKAERKSVTKAGLQLNILQGEEIPHHLYPQIYHFYSGTCDKFYWGSKYLTQRFFRQLYPHYRHRVMLATAHHPDYPDHPVGLSFCIRKGENLYGRYWGCADEFNCLHFEACYYKPIEWAIAEGIQRFDPGAGGRHKPRRGFPATPNHSLHRFYDPTMAKILAHYLPEINRMEAEEIELVNQGLPIKNTEITLESF